MTALIREWLLGITAAAILTALADGLMPEGGVKQVGKLVCGLVLMAVVLRPLQAEEREMLWQIEDARQVLLQTQQLQEEADAQMRTVIEEKLAAYSMDKGMQLGIPCRVQVSCTAGEGGIYLPHQVQVWGVSQKEQRDSFIQALSADLGLERQQILFREGEAP